ncbi:hypothetical protein ACHAXA_003458 [Cyclostephanos tholiformis]|uniref:Uncharacterized protein n=1 Tax=Cyclostephanos tholiformis TaxID=382380 RepID=A0ABD3R4A4_9STRA
MPAMLKGYFDRTLLRGETWDFPPPPSSHPGGETTTNMTTNVMTNIIGNNVGLSPKLTNVHRVMGISTYGATRFTTLASGDNGRNTISTAIRHGNFNPRCTCRWLGLYDLDHCDLDGRTEFLNEVRRVVREEF